MKLALKLLFSAVLAAMLFITVRATVAESLFAAGSRLWTDWWFRATLADAYFGFVAVFVWIAWRERTFAARALWFVLLMTLGNIAIAAYVLLALHGLGGSGIDGLFVRKAAPR